MSTNSNSLAEPGRIIASFGHLLAALGQDLYARSHRLWRAYWDYQARRATMLMLEVLDDRTLKDIGLSRSEIRPTVLGNDTERLRPYDPHWHRPVEL